MCTVPGTSNVSPKGLPVCVGKSYHPCASSGEPSCVHTGVRVPACVHTRTTVHVLLQLPSLYNKQLEPKNLHKKKKVSIHGSGLVSEPFLKLQNFS